MRPMNISMYDFFILAICRRYDGTGGYKCNDGYCIKESELCNNINNCFTGEDEKDEICNPPDEINQDTVCMQNL